MLKKQQQHITVKMVFLKSEAQHFKVLLEHPCIHLSPFIAYPLFNMTDKIMINCYMCFF